MNKCVHICLIAGEPSGDFLGAQLMKALKAQADVQFSGVGGPLMMAQGLNSLFPIDDLAVMGIAEVVPKLSSILKKIKQTSDFIINQKPDVVVTIDSPDFCFRVAKNVRAASPGIKLVHCVAPSVWAWREGRAEKISRIYDGLISFFDFEPPYFERHGLKTIAVGHPVVESGVREASGDSFRKAHGISGPTMGVFFGSRRGEIKRMGPVLVEVMKAFPEVTFIVPTLPHILGEVKELVSGLRVVVTTDPAEKWSAFKACDKAVAVSGTVGLELAVAGVAHVIAYRMNPVTYEIIRRMVKVKYAHLVNILIGREVVPEFIQDKCVAGMISEGIRNLNPLEIEIIDRLGTSPSQKAAGFVISFS